MPWSNNIFMQKKWSHFSGNQALFGVAKYQLHLFASHSRKPLQEVIDASAAFEILK